MEASRHVLITDLKPYYMSVLQDVGSLVYGWRPNGPGSWAEGGRFHAAYVMLDPYCPRVVPVVLPQVRRMSYVSVTLSCFAGQNHTLAATATGCTNQHEQHNIGSLLGCCPWQRLLMHVWKQ